MIQVASLFTMAVFVCVAAAVLVEQIARLL